MMVKDLISLLQTMPQDSIVILETDAEENGYSPLMGVDSSAVYEATTTWNGEVYFTNWTAKEVGMNNTAWEKLKKETPACVVLSPVN